VTAAACAVAVLALSGCGIQNVGPDAKTAALYNAGANYAQTTDCFKHLKLTPADDLTALAKRNNLCGDWRMIDATDEQLMKWRLDTALDSWIMHIEDDPDAPYVTIFTDSAVTGHAGVQSATREVVFCWKAVLSRSGAAPSYSDLTCPPMWLAQIAVHDDITREQAIAAFKKG
jgi:hypothetical protein